MVDNSHYWALTLNSIATVVLNFCGITKASVLEIRIFPGY